MVGVRTWGAIAATALLASAAPAQDPLAAARGQLRAARAASKAAAARASVLERQAGEQRDAARRAQAEEAAVAARIARAEADIDAARARVAIVDRLLRDQRAELGEKQAPVGRLLAALTSLARRPAVAAIAQPGSIDDLVHVRAVLGGVLPQVRARTAALRADLERTRGLQADAALAAKSLRDGRVALLTERQALASLQARHAAAATDLGRRALAESESAIALGEDARDLVDRMTAIGATDATLASLQRLPGPPRFDPAPGSAAAAYRLPVAGRLVEGMGETSANGVRARGLTFAVDEGSDVAAPADGRIVYAGKFRRFGAIVILDHGAGWTTLITGMDAASVPRGATVQSGQRIGRAGAEGESRVTVELRRRGRPIDITALIG